MPKSASEMAALSSTRERLQGLLKRVGEGDLVARAEATAIMDNEPEVWRSFANLPQQVELSLLDKTFGSWSLSEVAVRRRLSEIRSELGHADASPLEQMAIDRVVLTWLGVHLAEIIAAQNTTGSLANLDFYQRRLTQAQRRHLAAIRTLAVLRRLLVPAMPKVTIGQMNVAGKQLNSALVGAQNGSRVLSQGQEA